jgi:hypothetical protein
MSSSRIIYTPRLGATPEQEVMALAMVYRYILDAANKKAAAHAPDNGSNDAKESDSDCAATKNHNR